MWGSKGPFPSKAKALAVARAAYANGYKGEQTEPKQFPPLVLKKKFPAKN
jgi:hypothetical protein